VTCQLLIGSSQVVVKKILIEGEIGEKRGKFALATVLNGFYNVLATFQVSSRFLTGCCAILIGGERGEFALASGEEANIWEKAREDYCPQDY